MTTPEFTALEQRLTAAAQERAGAVADVEQARAREAVVIRDAVSRGVTKYRVAQLTGLTQPAVAKIAAGEYRGPRITDEQVDQLEAVLAAAGITTIPRLRKPPTAARSERPFFTVLWESDAPRRELPGWTEERATVWGEDPETPVQCKVRVFSVNPDRSGDWRAWLMAELRRAPQGAGRPLRVVEDLGSWWRATTTTTDGQGA